MTLTGLYGPAVFDSNGYALTLAGSLSGSGGLTAGLPLESGYPLAGGGTLTLAAQNSYRGPTTLNASMLVVANGSVGSATGTNSVTLNGGTLAAGPLGTITGAVYGGSGPHMIAPGAGLPAGQFGTLRLTDGLTTNANTTLLFDLGAPVTGGAYSGDLIDLGNSALTVGANTSIAFVINPMQPGDYRLFANVGNELRFPRELHAAPPERPKLHALDGGRSGLRSIWLIRSLPAAATTGSPRRATGPAKATGALRGGRRARTPATCKTAGRPA